MRWPLVALTILMLFAGSLLWIGASTRRRHACLSSEDVISALENLLTGESHDEWDLFLAHPIADPYLESVRQRCIAIDAKHGSAGCGKDLSEVGEAVVSEILEELRESSSGTASRKDGDRPTS